MSFNIGDYVRYKYENCIYIGKIKFISEVMGFEETLQLDIDTCMEEILKEDIIKSSPNIIDLIEVGDYVNGKKVVDKQYHYTDKDNYDIGEWCIFYENVALGDYQYNIKSIVTKEQFESMEYKIGE